MKFARLRWIGTGTVVLAGFILTLLVPKAAHAIAATAVQVMNTSVNPVPVQSILPGKPFAQSCFATSTECTLTPAVPAGYIFVVQHSSVKATGTPGGLQFLKWIFSTQGSSVQDFQLAQLSVSGAAVSDSQVAWYFDAGTLPELQIDSGTSVEAYLTGYLTQ